MSSIIFTIFLKKIDYENKQSIDLTYNLIIKVKILFTIYVSKISQSN